MSTALKVEAGTFEQEVIKSDKPVLVDFWAPWCGPCKMLTPTIEALAADYAGRIKVAKVNVDDNQELAVRFGIRGIPTVMVFKDGKAVESLVGLRSKEELAKVLDKNLA